MIKKLTKIGLMMLCAIMAVSAFAACSAKFDENKAIVVVSREEGSGSRNAFMELVYGAEKIDVGGPEKIEKYKTIVLPTAHVVQTSYSAVFNKVKTDPQTIAYDSYGFVTSAVKMLTVNGVACTAENIKNGTYKLMRPFSVVYREVNMTGANAKFLEYLNSSNAQTILSADGLIGDSTHTTAYVAQDDLTGTIKISGGSTVALLMEKYKEDFTKLQPLVTITISSTNSGGGRNDIKNGIVDFGMVGAAVTAEQMTDMQSTGHTVLVTKLCDDGIAVVVNKKNPITNITTQQLQNIYNKDAATTYSNWAALRIEQEAA